MSQVQTTSARSVNNRILEPAGLEFRTEIPVKMRIYTGVCDSRATLRVCRMFEAFGAALGKLKFTVRSGGSSNGEMALERGAAAVMANREIYLPWAGFNHHASQLYRIPEDAFRICSGVEPRWLYMGRSSRKLMARSCMELFGKNLDRPSLFLLCWTPLGNGTGDCAQAISLAKMRGIPVLDLGKYDSVSVEDAFASLTEALRHFGIESSEVSDLPQMRLPV